jgi:pellino protein
LQADDLFGSRDTILSSLSPISPEAFKKTPFFFSQCGHVFGPYKWTTEPSKEEEYKCPICNRNGQVVKLSMGMEPSFWLDTSNPTHAFTNCGHMASEKTIRYSSISY